MAGSASTKWRRVVRAGGIAACVVAFAALSGCGEYSDQSALDLAISEGQFVVVNCGDEEVGPPVRLLLTVRQPGGEWEDYFEASGEVVFGEDSEFTNDPDEWVEIYSNRVGEVEPGAKVEIGLTSGSRTSATYTVPAEGLADGEWLSHSGGVVAEPCR